MISPKISTSFWQSPLWGEILMKSWQARKVEKFSLGWEDILVEYRNIWLGMVWAFSLWIDVSWYSDLFFEKCSEWVCSQWAIFWQVEGIYMLGIQSKIHPQGVYGLPHGVEVTGVLRRSQVHTSYKHFLEPWTRVIDLMKSEGDILKEMHEKWRYNIRLAEKRGVTTEWVQPTRENINTWMTLLTDTTSRDRFAHNSRAYYEIFLMQLEKKNAGGLLFGYFEWEVIAAGIFVYHGEVAIYYYGASLSDPTLRKHMSPYLIQWEAIREGKRRWALMYDFLGIASPEDPDSPLKWVSEFKEKFGGEKVQLGQKYLFPLSWKYRVFLLMRNIKNSFSA